MAVISYYVSLMLFLKLTISHQGSTEKDRRQPRGKILRETLILRIHKSVCISQSSHKTLQKPTNYELLYLEPLTFRCCLYCADFFLIHSIMSEHSFLKHLAITISLARSANEDGG